MEGWEEGKNGERRRRESNEKRGKMRIQQPQDPHWPGPLRAQISLPSYSVAERHLRRIMGGKGAEIDIGFQAFLWPEILPSSTWKEGEWMNKSSLPPPSPFSSSSPSSPSPLDFLLPYPSFLVLPPPHCAMEQAVQNFREKYNQIPRITRALLTMTAVVTLVPAVGLVSPYRMLLLWPRVLGNLEVWRLLSTFFLHGVNISLLFTGIFLHRYSTELETETFQGRPADYAWFLLLTSASSLAGSLALGLPVLSQSLLTSIITLWSRRAGRRIVQFYFGFQFEVGGIMVKEG